MQVKGFKILATDINLYLEGNHLLIGSRKWEELKHFIRRFNYLSTHLFKI